MSNFKIPSFISAEFSRVSSKEQKEEIESLNRAKHFEKVLKETREVMDKEYREEEKEIEETYNEKEGFVYKATDKPLTPTLLSKLRDSQDIHDNNPDSPE